MQRRAAGAIADGARACGGAAWQWIPDLDPNRIVVTRSGKDATRLHGAHVMVVPYSQFRNKSRIMPELQRIVSDVAARVERGCTRRSRTYRLPAGSSWATYSCLSQRPNVVIADESHYLKNKDAQRTKGVTAIVTRALRVILLSGDLAASGGTDAAGWAPCMLDACFIVAQARRRWRGQWSCTRS